VALVVALLAPMVRHPGLVAGVNYQALQTFGRIFGLLFLKRQQISQPAEPGTLRAPYLAVAAVSAVLAYLAKAATVATVDRMALMQPATGLEVAEVAVQQTEGMDLMDICGLHTGAPTNGYFRSI